LKGSSRLLWLKATSCWFDRQSLHDRHLVFNDRCWLLGGSLKDAGKKPFNCIEVVDKAGIVADLENRWMTATPFP